MALIRMSIKNGMKTLQQSIEVYMAFKFCNDIGEKQEEALCLDGLLR